MEASIVFQDEIPILIDENLNFLDTHSRGFHAYMDIWNPETGEELEIFKEPENKHDKIGVTVKEYCFPRCSWSHWTTHKLSNFSVPLLARINGFSSSYWRESEP